MRRNGVDFSLRLVLSAGMDDYLSKPLRPHALERMLERYASLREVAKPDAIVTQPESADQRDSSSPPANARVVFRESILG